ncbi:MAG: ABC transporter ATP-binding protein [Clostridiales bacterium]|jgi:NitT/TauT family transport system ATP-binding protein|nr:ABC transporter ATP-binding protein [Clostridiales bacterium]
MKNILELDSISKIYHDPKTETLALKDISFSVADGELLSIIGPSGCGKSTLLSIISGLVAPSSGEVRVLRENAALGYMLQQDHLFGWRTIFQNACLGLEIQKKKTPENLAHVHELLERYGLGDFKNSKPSQLSGGMRQRAALIRTLAVKPDILLLDEPFSALDYQTRLRVSAEIAEIIRQEKKTAVFVTHDISEAVAVSDRVAVLTKRPATLASIHEIKLSPGSAREAPEFRLFFNAIWKELGVNE